MADITIADLGGWFQSFNVEAWEEYQAALPTAEEKAAERAEWADMSLGGDPVWGKIYTDPRQVMVERRNAADRLARTRMMAIAEIGAEEASKITPASAASIIGTQENWWEAMASRSAEYRDLEERKGKGLLTGVEEYKLSLLRPMYDPVVPEYTEGIIDQRMKGARQLVQADPEVAPIQVGGGGPKVERGKRATGKQPFTKRGAQGAQI